MCQLGQVGWYCYFDHPYSCWFSVHLFYQLLRGVYRNLWLWLWICLFIFVILRFLLYIFQNFIHFSSVAQSCLTFCDPVNCSMPGILSVINSQSLPKLKSIESVKPSNQLILCRPLLLPPSIFPSIRVFSNESVLHIKWPKYWSFSFNISPSNEYSELISL